VKSSGLEKLEKVLNVFRMSRGVLGCGILFADCGDCG
jgi:hypothetical protein